MHLISISVQTTESQFDYCKAFCVGFRIENKRFFGVLRDLKKLLRDFEGRLHMRRDISYDFNLTSFAHVLIPRCK